MSSLGHPPLSRLICPAERTKHNQELSWKGVDGVFFLVLDNYYILSGEDDDSSYSHHLYPLFWCNNKESKEKFRFSCGACRCLTSGTDYYFCNECDESYHKECVESPPIMESVFHPKHHLQLVRFVGLSTESTCGSCEAVLSKLFYHCSICNFSIDLVCATKPTVINYKKVHEHLLNYFPRETSLACDVCGVIDSKYLIYVCLQCGFIVHKNCIYLPFVIRISRHEHRLSLTYSSSNKKLSCGVCRQKINENYGQYICIKGCNYVVHPKCGTRMGVWDLKDLEEEPEEVYENLNSYEVIGAGVIQHFSHSHRLKYVKETSNILYDEKTKCHACILPVYDGDIYKCMDSMCGFLLHEACANLPRKKDHMAHPFQLILKVSDTETYFICKYCRRYLRGFRYECCRLGRHMIIDVRCAAISEPFNHQCHIHPLFLTNEIQVYKTCSMCGKEVTPPLNCSECDFVSCFRCATFPFKVRYEHDEHFLTLSYEEIESPYWCEVCEEVIASSKWLYTCNECGVTLHIECLLGKDVPYINYSLDIFLIGNYNKNRVTIVPNYGLSRPICDRCGRRCKDKQILECDGRRLCSYEELGWPFKPLFLDFQMPLIFMH